MCSTFICMTLLHFFCKALLLLFLIYRMCYLTIIQAIKLLATKKLIFLENALSIKMIGGWWFCNFRYMLRCSKLCIKGGILTLKLENSIMRNEYLLENWNLTFSETEYLNKYYIFQKKWRRIKRFETEYLLFVC